MAQPFAHRLIEDPDELRSYLAEFDVSKPVIADTESTGLELDAVLLGFSFFQKGVLPAFVVRQTPFHQGRGIPMNVLQDILNPWFSQLKTIWQNAKYDTIVLEMNGFVIPEVVADTIVEIHLVDPVIPKKLETRVQGDFGYAKKTFEEVIGRKWDKIVWDVNTWQIFTLEQLGEYAAEDAYWTDLIHDLYSDKVAKLQAKRVHDRIELPMIPVLRDMKIAGIKIDTKVLTKIGVQCTTGIRRLEQKIFQEAGDVFNINSSEQSAKILYDKLKYKCPKLTPKGKRSTDKFALEVLSGKGCAVAKLMMEHSQLSTLLSGFITNIPGMLGRDGRLRGDFNSVGTDTGRLSASKPNLQNQPNNKDYPIRQAYVAADGELLWILDYSQIELRIAAHLSRDSRLMQAFLQGRDIHQEVATSLGISRASAKIVNFAILYGLGAASLSIKLGIDEFTAQLYIDDYYATYAGVRDWKKYVEQKAKQDGYVMTMFGRVRPLANVRSQNAREYYHGLRQAVNTSIQGAAADLIKLAMIRVHAMLKEERLPGRLLLQVHDELVGEGKKSHAQRIFNKVKHIMENVTPMRVPIEADGKLCHSWDQMKNDSYKGALIQAPTDIDLISLGLLN